MALTLRLRSSQKDFNARSGGSCWGISFIFCMKALEQKDAISALRSMLKNKDTIAKEIDDLMKTQSGVLFNASQGYARNAEGEAITGITTPEGFHTENIAIQARHSSVKTEAKKSGNKCIGTISSFFEGGKHEFIRRLQNLCQSAGLAAGHVGLQGGGSHSVALFWHGTTLYFFDPNDGVYQAESSSLANNLHERFAHHQYIYAHVYRKAS